MSDKARTIIYTRIASAMQTVDSTSNPVHGQEERCRGYAEDKGYQVVKVFQDIAVSGNGADRPAFNDMLTFLKNEAANGEIAVVIETMQVLARNMKDYWDLKGRIEDAGGRLESTDATIAATPESELFQNYRLLWSEYEDSEV